MAVPMYDPHVGLHVEYILEPRDALTLSAVCRRMHEVGKRNHDVAVFAITRPLVSESAGLTLSSWSNVWRACFSIVQAEGWCAGVWARALEFNVLAPYPWNKSNSLRLACNFIHTIWSTGEDQGRICDLDPEPMKVNLQQETVACKA